MGTPVEIELLDAETSWTDENVGRKRQANAEAQHRTPSYGQPSSEAPAAHILGARGEAASYKWAKPVKWHHFHTGLEKKPDLHDFIEVRTRPLHWQGLIVRPGDAEDWAYLHVTAEDHPRYVIHGWMWGFEAKQSPLMELAPRDPVHVIDDFTLLKDPELLLLVLRERQQHPERIAADAAHQ